MSFLLLSFRYPVSYSNVASIQVATYMLFYYFIEQKRPSRVCSTDIAGSKYSNFINTTTDHDMPGSVWCNPITFDSSKKQQTDINFDEELSYGINKT